MCCRPGTWWAGPRRWSRRWRPRRLCGTSAGQTCCARGMKRSEQRLRLARTPLTLSSAMERRWLKTSTMLQKTWGHFVYSRRILLCNMASNIWSVIAYLPLSWPELAFWHVSVGYSKGSHQTGFNFFHFFLHDWRFKSAIALKSIKVTKHIIFLGRIFLHN